MKNVARYSVIAVICSVIGVAFLKNISFGRGAFPFDLPPGISIVQWDRESWLHAYEMRIKLKGDSVDQLREFGEKMLIESNPVKNIPVIEMGFPDDWGQSSNRNRWFDLENVKANNSVRMGFDLEPRITSVAVVVLDVDRKFLYFSEVK